MKKILFCLAFCLAFVGCGSDNNTSTQNNNNTEEIQQQEVSQESQEETISQLVEQCKKERENKNFEKAISLGNEIIRLDDKSSIGFSELGLVYYEKGDISDAKQYLEEALKRNPDDQIAKETKKIVDEYIYLLDNCRKEREKGNFEAALQFAKTLIEKNNNDSIAYSELGWTYYEMGDIEKAKENVEKSLQINPDNEIVKKDLEKINSK